MITVVPLQKLPMQLRKTYERPHLACQGQSRFLVRDVWSGSLSIAGGFAGMRKIKVWSEENDFPVAKHAANDFPVVNENGNDFPVKNPVGKIERFLIALLATMLVITAVWLALNIIAILITLGIIWYQALIQSPIWVSLITGTVLVVFTYIFRRV